MRITLLAITLCCCVFVSTNHAQTTAPSSTDHPSTAANALQALPHFVPVNAELLVAFDPEQLRANHLVNWLLSYEVLHQGLPGELGKVELVVLGGTAEALGKVSAPDYTAFDDIAAQIGGEPVPKPKGPATKLNQPFAGLLRFEHTLLSSEIENWLTNAADESLHYEAVRENGWEVFRCENTESCVVVRIDQRTLIVGGRDTINAGLSRMASVDSQPSDLAKLIDPGMANRTATVIVSGRVMSGQFAKEFEALAQANWLRVELDESPLMQARIAFNSSKTASAAITELIEPYQNYLTEMKAFWVPANDSDSELRWLVNEGVKLMESLQVGVSGSDLVIVLQRPDNWTEIMERVDAWQQRARRDAEAAFQETTRQLEAATDAAQSALEDASAEAE